MLRLIVLLKNGLLLKNSTFLYAQYRVVLQNGHILVSIHPPLNLCNLSYTLPAHTSPYHNLSSPKLHSPLNINPSPTCFHTHCFPSDPILLIFVSSDQTTLFQFSTVHSMYFKAKAKHFFLCIAMSNGFFFFVTALNECFLRTFLTVCELTGWGMMVLMS